MSEESALRKLLAGPVAFSTPRYPTLALTNRQMADEAEAEAKARGVPLEGPLKENIGKLRAEADRLDKVVLAGELYPLTQRDAMEVDLGLATAHDVARDSVPSSRDLFMRTVIPRVNAHVMLRVPGTKGRERVLTAAEAAQLDLSVAQAVVTAYAEHFVVAPGELPKPAARAS